MSNNNEMHNCEVIEEKLYSLPGYDINTRLSAFINSTLLYQANAREIQSWYAKLNEPTAALILWNPENHSLLKQTNLEMQRRFSNFLMSTFAARDHWYAIRDEYYKDTEILEKINILSEMTFSNNGLTAFMQDFRNYVVHKGYPKVSQQLSFGGNKVANDILFDREQLLKFKKWTSTSKRYIKNIQKSVRLIDIVNEYSNILDTYYNKVIELLIDYHRTDLKELKNYKEKYGLKFDMVRI